MESLVILMELKFADFNQVFTKFLLPKIYIFTYWCKLSLCFLNRDRIKERQFKFPVGHEKVIEEAFSVSVRKAHVENGCGREAFGRSRSKS